MIIFRMDSPTKTFITSAGLRLTTLKPTQYHRHVSNAGTPKTADCVSLSARRTEGWALGNVALTPRQEGFNVVPRTRIELVSRSAADFKSAVFTYFTTWALNQLL
jgi:hypothetical protein